MISVEEALERILAPLQIVGAETIAVDRALNRVLANDAVARRTQPPFDASAMDGWAIRHADLASSPKLKAVGQSQAGAGFDRPIAAGETVRIFTGAPVPDGADTILLQEDAEEADGFVTIREMPKQGRHIRRRGLDFFADQTMLKAGHVVTARDMMLLAGMDLPWLSVRRRPRVALLATGDELVRPGEPCGPGQIVASNQIGLAGLIESCGGEALDLGIAKDDTRDLAALARGARGADFLVTIGGASVGERDLVARALGEVGLQMDFWKIAMRPGKPLMSGNVGGTPFLGLPGNPVAAMICALIYLQPALLVLQGRKHRPDIRPARLGRALAANDRRADFLRARITGEADGQWIVEAFDVQDSSTMSTLATADVLILRPPYAHAVEKHALVDVMPL